VVYFNGEKLYQVVLAASDNEKNPRWEDWSEEHERQMKMYYSTLLSQLFGVVGARFHKFSWGKASAIYDEKSGEVIFL